jgi:hypothetical protein
VTVPAPRMFLGCALAGRFTRCYSVGEDDSYEGDRAFLPDRLVGQESLLKFLDGQGRTRSAMDHGMTVGAYGSEIIDRVDFVSRRDIV